MKKEDKLESRWPASPSHRQCEVGTQSPQPPLKSLNALAEGRRGELKPLAKMVFTQRVQVVPCLLPSPLGFPFAPLLTPPCQGLGFGSCWLRLSQGSHLGVGLCWAISSPMLRPLLSAPTLLLTLPCYNHVLNTLQALLDVFLTHFLWGPCNLLCRNNCNLFKCQQATRGRQQLCARAEQLQGTGPISPLEQRSKPGERKRSFASIN